MIQGRLVLATSNTRKLEELRVIFDDLCGRSGTPDTPIEIVGLDALNPRIDEPIEDKDTFEGNAIIKARHYADASGTCCLADDSGLEVDSLAGEPGVRSARYAWVAGLSRKDVDAANIELLLRNLGDTPVEERAARFVCVMAVCMPNVVRPLAVVRGTVEGRILGPGDAGYCAHGPSGRGENGFGYDPVFFVPELGLTAAEMSQAQKNSISHRGNAARLMWHEIVNARGA